MMAQWTYRQAWVCLVGSTLATLSLSLSGYLLCSKWKQHRLSDERSRVVAIVQTGPEREALKTAVLASILGLSADCPVSLYAIDETRAEKILLACPLISEAKVKRAPPGTLYIDYTVRKPIAYLADYQNTGLDREGYVFPIAPFYSPKNLPEIYLGLPPFGAPADGQGRSGGEWQKSLQNKHLQLAFEILHVLDDAPWREGMRLKRIDVSNAFASSAGLREIVLFTEDELTFRENDREIVCQFPKILRLPLKEYTQQLGNFLSLRRTMLDDYQRQAMQAHYTSSLVQFAPRIIDLRIPQIAYVQNN
ncbi:MAG: Uncharacterized protein HW387_829 [Parachlamydiales bacterium]|nr:Uncharacterized protein [Parachlamydiales bacterium]